MMGETEPIPNLWEGGYNGEKFNHELKARLRGGLTANWHVNVLKGVLKDDALQRIELPIKEEGSGDFRQSTASGHSTNPQQCIATISKVKCITTINKFLLACNDAAPGDLLSTTSTVLLLSARLLLACKNAPP